MAAAVARQRHDPESGRDLSPVLMLMGPTAAGKSGLALALAERVPVEIISVDSAQIYRGMDIGTAKPSAAERARVPHHLIDILDPSDSYSAARFAAEARVLIEQIRQRGRVPLLVGGTMLYFRALLHGLSELPPADPSLRARLQALAREHGWPALHERLRRVDPVTAARLHPNDRQRIARALEIVELTGKPASALHGPAGKPALEGRVLRFALVPERRAELHARIDQRFEQMMRQGFLDEVRRLWSRGDLRTDLPSMRAVGYRQLWAHLDGRLTLDEAVAQGKAATRQYAKRQLTWLRGEPGLSVLDSDRADPVATILDALEQDRGGMRRGCAPGV
ncbi:tRNA (adenosine(37)-N6)-dimethylallyltransferase MiaA [Fontimonas sp. SYSU GA230001]|uniref:tRNA (adenosine(37)-N6)-dimethylallyltransferase MiaA n=1 Tax=Fontimonas sp. SYSU GA230001 TaxID=3142450 RepID=UPI0032B5A298